MPLSGHGKPTQVKSTFGIGKFSSNAVNLHGDASGNKHMDFRLLDHQNALVCLDWEIPAPPNRIFLDVRVTARVASVEGRYGLVTTPSPTPCPSRFWRRRQWIFHRYGVLARSPSALEQTPTISYSPCSSSSLDLKTCFDPADYRPRVSCDFSAPYFGDPRYDGGLVGDSLANQPQGNLSVMNHDGETWGASPYSLNCLLFITQSAGGKCWRPKKS